MRTDPKRLAFVMSCALLALCGAARAEDTALPKSAAFETAKITVNARAHADGYLRVVLHAEGGASVDATIAVHKHESENDIAKNIAKALAAAAGKNYDIDRDAGEHVKIHKADRKSPNFSVEITFSAPGFSIILDT
jgi:hypothetical protein